MTAARIDVPADAESVDDYFYRRGLSDGLPIVAPTPERVEQMLTHHGLSGAEVVGEVPVERRIADMESIAVNCVMAGCRAEHLPAVVACLRAMLAPDFGLDGVQATTHVCAPLAVFGGPAVERLEINSGAGALGPGVRANAVIGRAVRLILLNIGGAAIGAVDKSTFGQPGKYTYVAGENRAANPWTTLAEDEGFSRDQSTVTVFAAEAPHNVNDHNSQSARGVLTTIAGTLSELGHNNLYMGGCALVVMGGEHAAMCAREGMTKADVRQAIFELSAMRIGDVWWENRKKFALRRPDPFATGDPEDPVAAVNTPEDVVVTVFGGSGRHSLVIPTFGASSRPQTVDFEC